MLQDYGLNREISFVDFGLDFIVCACLTAWLPTLIPSGFDDLNLECVFLVSFGASGKAAASQHPAKSWRNQALATIKTAPRECKV
jgi:hypothetical protein